MNAAGIGAGLLVLLIATAPAAAQDASNPRPEAASVPDAATTPAIVPSPPAKSSGAPASSG